MNSMQNTPLQVFFPRKNQTFELCKDIEVELYGFKEKKHIYSYQTNSFIANPNYEQLIMSMGLHLLPGSYLVRLPPGLILKCTSNHQYHLIFNISKKLNRPKFDIYGKFKVLNNHFSSLILRPV